ncbi:hypothetical protein AUK40_02280 [Candidatus Wirthbacteria bacterium CG2_30_54_11]|uniref:Uncharacterized protein n=1 Tax=Candidatus Wirthbacteria bacterium CG2_30_54_11 TaxID=1817892 RepID=A0A1J5IL78_9BACT|nr:MAG: hypothetical protein AUK40_02280 [Candidatus Wirthbacteria bacterium CG2_30_54_11]
MVHFGNGLVNLPSIVNIQITSTLHEQSVRNQIHIQRACTSDENKCVVVPIRLLSGVDCGSRLVADIACPVGFLALSSIATHESEGGDADEEKDKPVRVRLLC